MDAGRGQEAGPSWEGGGESWTAPRLKGRVGGARNSLEGKLECGDMEAGKGAGRGRGGKRGRACRETRK